MANYNMVAGAYVKALEVKINAYVHREVELIELLSKANLEKEHAYKKIQSLTCQVVEFRRIGDAQEKHTLADKDRQIMKMEDIIEKLEADFSELRSDIDVYMEYQEGVNRESQYKVNTETEEACEIIEAFKCQVLEINTQAAIRNTHVNAYVDNKERQIAALQYQINGQLQQIMALELNFNQMASGRENHIKELEFQLRELSTSRSPCPQKLEEQKISNQQNDKKEVNDMRNQEIMSTEEQEECSVDSLENDSDFSQDHWF